MNGLPDTMANGAVTDAVPASATSPGLKTENVSELVVPVVTDPKLRLAGVTTKPAGLSATIRFTCVLVLTPTGPVTINRTVFVPATA